jgi:hypothetical protein
MKACKNLHTAAAVALKLSQSSITCVEDLWSSDKIDFRFEPQPQKRGDAMRTCQIIFRSILKYLDRPGQVSLPAGMITLEDFQRERNNPVFRVRKFWEFWHGSQTLDLKSRRTVSMQGGLYPDRQQAYLPSIPGLHQCRETGMSTKREGVP